MNTVKINTVKINTVKWLELKPLAFRERLAQCPVAYLPYGLAEPHGFVAAFGLDTFKAEWLCEQAATVVGGIVAPTQNWHVHESGYHAPWLEGEVGEDNPHLGGLPPYLVYQTLLYQLRAIQNAGFHYAVVLTGHCGGNERDLEVLAQAYQKQFGLKVLALSDVDLVKERYQGDHAGAYELSQLLYIRPELVDMGLLGHHHQELSALCLGADAAEASATKGEAIMTYAAAQLGERVREMLTTTAQLTAHKRISFDDVDNLWQALRSYNWLALRLHPGQKEVSKSSQWWGY